MSRSIFLTLRVRTSPLWVIFEINFLRHLAMAVLTAVISLYFKQFVHSNAGVAMIFFVGYASATVSSFYSGYIIERLKKRKALVIALMAFTLVFAAFSMAKNTATIFFLFAIYQFILSLIIMDISLYIKHYSDFKTLAENGGKLGSFGNIGWLIGPLLGSLIADKFGFKAVFLFSSFIALIAFASFFFLRLAEKETVFPHRNNFRHNIKIFFKNPNLRRTYINNAGLGFIYSLWDFLPLLMFGIGATIPMIGLTKTLMGVPQSIFEFPIGRIADRETGERKIFIVGYALAVIFTLLLGLTHDLKLFITFFFLAATGTSFLEMTRDSYFFRQMPEREIELVSVYRTSDTISYMFGQGLAMLALLFVPINWWFIIGASLASVFIINAYKLKELPRNPLSL